MQRDIVVKSRSLGGSSDLTLLAKLKPGFIDSLESVTYKTRTKRVLELLHGARMAAHEHHTARLISDSVERVGAIHSVRVTVLEPEDKVLLVVTFDGSWESYIRVLWDKVGSMLDLIFCGTEDYVTAAEHSFEEWMAWGRRVQVETGFFYGPAEATARDCLYHRRAERMRERGAATDLNASELNEIRTVLPSAESEVHRLVTGDTSLPDDPQYSYPDDVRIVRERIRNGLQGAAALYRLTDLHRPGTPDGDVLRRAALYLLLEFVKDFSLMKRELEKVYDRFARQLDWLFPGFPKFNVPAAFARRVPQPAWQRADIDPVVRADIQGGILHAYGNTTHGLVLMLAFDGAPGTLAFLKAIDGRITSDGTADPAKSEFWNVAFTPAGLRTLGLTEDEIELFPEEFRQGMAARAGLLGDVRNNHPRRWRLPRRFIDVDTPPSATDTIEVETVHAILQLRCEAKSKVALATDEYFEQDHPLRTQVQQILAIQGLRVLAIQSLKRRFRQEHGRIAIVEHFGYADGDGQPEVEAGPIPYFRNRVNLGEIVHGHDNTVDFKIDPDDPTAPEQARARMRWLLNGSFLVLRKYRQFVSRFEKAVAAAAERIKSSPTDKTDYAAVVYGKLMGRKRDGTPMANESLVFPKLNLFDYGNDEQGRKCPLHAHIRRAHPRLDPDVAGRIPRLMRRSMSYGPERENSEGDDDADRGLVFMAYNADLGEQFEVVQRWLTGGNSTGSTSGESCPIVGVPENGLPRQFRFEHPDANGAAHAFHAELEEKTLLFGEPAVLTQLEWGMYLFAPSLSVLRHLRIVAETSVSVAPAVPVPWQAERGRKLLAALKLVEANASPDAAKAAWKAAIEDPESVDRLDSASIWAAIREDHGGLLKTPYGTLVADRELLKQVLLNADARYSVCGQFERMKRSFGEISLGMDDGPIYRQQSDPINAAIEKLKMDEVFDLARDAANEKIDQILTKAKKQADDGHDTRFEASFEAREITDHVLAVLSEDWFGLKDGQRFRRGSADWYWQRGQPPLYPGHFTALSRYMFQPNPGPVAEELGQHYGQALREAMNRFVADHRTDTDAKKWKKPTKRDSKTPAPIAAAIFDHRTHGRDNDFVARNMVGVLMGFNPTIIGAVLNVLREWQRDGSFGALRARLAYRTDFTTAYAELYDAMRDAARMRPMPQIGWRTALKPHCLGAPCGGSVEVAAGDIIVLANVSGTQQSLADGCKEGGKEDGRLMFGGAREDKPHPTHACPGYAAGIGAMLGTLTALLARREAMRQGVAALTIALEGPSDYVPASAPPLKATPAAAAESLKDLREVQAAAKKAAPGSLGRVLGWGDSWLDYRNQFTDKDMGIDLRDQLAGLGYDMPKKYCIWTDWTKVEDMAADPTQFCGFLRNDLQMNGPRAILLSGGGNDCTEGTLQAMIYQKGTVAKTILDPDLLGAQIEKLKSFYWTILDAIKEEFRITGKTIPVFVHGYDYPLPRGILWSFWLWWPFKNKGYNCNKPADLALGIRGMAEVINAFNTMLSGLNAKYPFVHHVTLTGTIKGNWPANDGADGWANDLHPIDDAFALLAAKIHTEIQKHPPPP